MFTTLRVGGKNTVVNVTRILCAKTVGFCSSFLCFPIRELSASAYSIKSKKAFNNIYIRYKESQNKMGTEEDQRRSFFVFQKDLNTTKMFFQKTKQTSYWQGWLKTG